jgi:hypothetical protein
MNAGKTLVYVEDCIFLGCYAMWIGEVLLMFQYDIVLSSLESSIQRGAGPCFVSHQHNVV